MDEHSFEWVTSLKEQLSQCLDCSSGELDLKILGSSSTVDDSMTGIVVTNGKQSPKAFVQVSNNNFPEMAALSASSARQARALAKTDSLKAHILDPIDSGYLEKCSYVVWPYCKNPSDSRYLYAFFKRFYSLSILNWLLKLNVETMTDPGINGLSDFKQNLLKINNDEELSDVMRSDAEHAISRLDLDWKVKNTLMHGDLWVGNFLGKGDMPVQKGINFHVIDWAGSTTKGYPFYDLVRLCGSFPHSEILFKKELSRHMKAFSCTKDHARWYLLSALGHIANNLECFPKEQYIYMANKCYKIFS